MSVQSLGESVLKQNAGKEAARSAEWESGASRPATLCFCAFSASATSAACCALGLRREASLPYINKNTCKTNARTTYYLNIPVTDRMMCAGEQHMLPLSWRMPAAPASAAWAARICCAILAALCSGHMDAQLFALSVSQAR